MRRLIATTLALCLFSLAGQLMAQDTATIQGYVYNDLNRNMIRDAGEYGFFQIPIVANGDSTATDLDGFYQLAVAAPGSYDVIKKHSTGESTTPDTVAVDVEPGGVYNVDFGEFLGLATIYGFVFNDLNWNGYWDQPGEPPIPGVTIHADGDSTTTDVDGLYYFLVDAPGIYRVEERDLPGYFSTTSNQVNISIEPDHSYRVDFGDAERIELTATISGTVFDDADGDGIRGAGEPGIPGVTVGADGGSMTTDAFGEYSLSVSAPATHDVTETDPVGYHSTTPNVMSVSVTGGGSYQVDFGDRMREVGSRVDIKPTSCPNPFNTKSNGKLPVAILGTDSFDVNYIDPSTVRLEGVAPLKSAYEDVATPAGDGEPCECTEAGPDGYLDLVLHFSRQDLVIAMGPVTDGEMRELTLTALTYAGNEFEGSDCVWIKRKADNPGPPPPVIEVGDTDGEETQITVTLEEASDFSMVVYDVQGRRVRVLADQVLAEGGHTFQWDGRDDAGTAVVGGVYFCRVKTGVGSETVKLFVAPR